MSRVGEDGGDDQRIQEAAERSLKERIDQEKRDTVQRTTQSFQQVVQTKTQQLQQQKNALHATRDNVQQTHEKKDAEQQGSILSKIVAQKSDEQSQLRRSALATMMNSGLVESRMKAKAEAAGAELDRNEQLLKTREDDSIRSDEEKRVDDEKEAARDAERVEEKKFDAAHSSGLAVDKDGSNKEQRRGQSGDREGKKGNVEGVEGAKGALGTAHASQAIIDKIVNAIYKAIEVDGRTELALELKGSMLDGVRVQIRAQDGKVALAFSNCGRELKNLLESSKGELMRRLDKKGLSLSAMTVG